MTNRKIFQALFAAIFVLSIFGCAAPQQAAIAKAQPQLQVLAAREPSQLVRVIAQKMAGAQEAEALVAMLGGKVRTDLSIINAFAAEMTAAAALELAQSDGVRWVSLDVPVESTAVSPQTLMDDFNKVSFDNNDGTQQWASAWIEDDAQGLGASGGNVWVESGSLRLAGGINQSVTREADLGHAMNGTGLLFAFSFGPAVQSGTDKVVLEISSDGGQTYKSLITFGSYSGGTNGTFAGTIANYVSSHTRIRYRILAGYDRPDAYFAINSIEVRYDANPLSSGPAYNTYLDTLGVRQAWSMGYTGNGIGVAIIDSGVNKEADFGRRIKKLLSFNSNSNTVNDTYGHGTHVAGIVGGDDADGGGRFTGIAPGVSLISLKINDETGMAYESDMVEAMQWALDYKKKLNIRVVNLSVNSTMESSYHNSPVDAAAEILWFNGIVVVASAGNKGAGNEPNTANAAPANDPFIITVGASHENWTASREDDTVGSFSSYGTTLDGFVKPDIIAPGKDIISDLSSQSSWYTDHAERVVQEDYFRISGTSMAAPMVTGAVALLLQAEPDLTPDQVKYRLLHTGSTIPGSSSDPRSYPYLDISAAITNRTSESANTGQMPSLLLATGPDAVDFASVGWNSVGWNSVGWNSVGWNSVGWNSVGWNSVGWNSTYWGE